MLLGILTTSRILSIACVIDCERFNRLYAVCSLVTGVLVGMYVSRESVEKHKTFKREGEQNKSAALLKCTADVTNVTFVLLHAFTH